MIAARVRQNQFLRYFGRARKGTTVMFSLTGAHGSQVTFQIAPTAYYRSPQLHLDEIERGIEQGYGLAIEEHLRKRVYGETNAFYVSFSLDFIGQKAFSTQFVTLVELAAAKRLIQAIRRPGVLISYFFRQQRICVVVLATASAMHERGSIERMHAQLRKVERRFSFTHGIDPFSRTAKSISYIRYLSEYFTPVIRALPGLALGERLDFRYAPVVSMGFSPVNWLVSVTLESSKHPIPLAVLLEIINKVADTSAAAINVVNQTINAGLHQIETLKGAKLIVPIPVGLEHVLAEMNRQGKLASNSLSRVMIPSVLASTNSTLAMIEEAFSYYETNNIRCGMTITEFGLLENIAKMRGADHLILNRIDPLAETNTITDAVKLQGSLAASPSTRAIVMNVNSREQLKALFQHGIQYVSGDAIHKPAPKLFLLDNKSQLKAVIRTTKA
ncbi:unnamed protein product [Didymodactylos carnosus]|uniref:EAL domain-containing protein n=1 Tax=Didymodactylos carnosus TaxID=1234261 RepID=A0A8S2H1L6_9BILA|nr:unnamed protein product [Didymodactylos carnosus]CAF3581207.1 unnamed protein product [Didymodactylos carnosus]